MSVPNAWPDLNLTAWAATKKSLHLYSQMLGKLRLGLAPDQPNWMFTALALDARGFTTGAMPVGHASAQASIDVFSSQLRVARSDGRSVDVALQPPKTVADVFAAFLAALAELEIDVAIWPKPQEIADTTPLDTDRRPAAYDPEAVQRWFTAMTTIAGVFDRWRAHFFGRTGIVLWWGGFDFALMLFSGKHVPAPTDRGYIMRYDLDAELMNVGIYLGDEASPAPFFYGYLYPHPAGTEARPLAPAEASWSQQLGEWVLPYEVVRTATDPDAALRTFLDAIYDRACSDGGWDRAEQSYDHPPRRRRV
jgi:hypothetical protein